jgi:hypothetical protein
MRHYSILEYANFRWFKAALVVSTVCAALYIWHDPPLKPYGGTWLGYTLGTVGAILILWLLWYGVRKRQYRSTTATVQGWLSAHVYLGAALVVIVTLHTGFELGWNVHTLAYVLMLAVVASGFYGVFFYARVPRAMTQNLGESTLDSILLRIGDLDREARAQALSLPDECFKLVDRSVTQTRLAGARSASSPAATPDARRAPRSPRGPPPAAGCAGRKPTSARRSTRSSSRRTSSAARAARPAPQGPARPLALHPRAARRSRCSRPSSPTSSPSSSTGSA